MGIERLHRLIAASGIAGATQPQPGRFCYGSKCTYGCYLDCASCGSALCLSGCTVCTGPCQTGCSSTLCVIRCPVSCYYCSSGSYPV